MCGVRPQRDIDAIAGSAEDYREGRQPWPRSPSVRSAQNLWMDLSVAQILATVADSDSSGDLGWVARDLACSASKAIRMSSGSIRFASNTAVAKSKPRPGRVEGIETTNGLPLVTSAHHGRVWRI